MGSVSKSIATARAQFVHDRLNRAGVLGRHPEEGVLGHLPPRFATGGDDRSLHLAMIQNADQLPSLQGAKDLAHAVA